MLITEEQARTKWCPHVRLDVIDSECRPHNRILVEESDSNSPEQCAFDGPLVCISSCCMAWRWGPTSSESVWVHPVDNGDGKFEDPMPPEDDGRGEWMRVSVRHDGAHQFMRDRRSDLGYCGLSGTVGGR